MEEIVLKQSGSTPGVVLSVSESSGFHSEDFSASVPRILKLGSQESLVSLSDFSQLYKLPGGNQVDGLPPAASRKCDWSPVGHVGRQKIVFFFLKKT